MEYSKEDLMEAKRQILGVGENMGTEESKKIWEKNAQFWDNAMGDKSNEFHREVVRPKVTELLSPNPADYILDIACGNGNYSSYLAQRGASIVAFVQPGAGRCTVCQHRFQSAGPDRGGGRHQRGFPRGAGPRLPQ